MLKVLVTLVLMLALPTLKVVLINSNKEIISLSLWSNHGKPLEKSREIIEKIYELLPKGAYIAHSGVTGYGEAFS